MKIFLVGLAALLTAPGLRAQPLNEAPTLVLSRSNVVYSKNAGPLLLDEAALVRDPDSPNFDGGTLTVAFVSEADPDDRLAIRNQGAGPGNIFISGSTVSYAIQPIGAFSGGANGASPLVVAFNGKATTEAVQALARNITYENLAARSSPRSRRVRLVLTDGDEGTSAPAFLEIHFALSNSPPVAIAKVLSSAFLAPPSASNVLLAANNSNAVAVLDGSMSSDGDGDALTYLWFDGSAHSPFAVGSHVTSRLAVGLHPLRLQVSDGRVSSEANVTLEIITPAEAIEGMVRSMVQIDLPRQRRQPLIATLKAASAAFQRGQFAAATHHLNTFQKKIRVQVAPDSAALAAELTQNTQTILDALRGH